MRCLKAIFAKLPVWRGSPACGFSFYDALIVAAALALNCTELLTEDMQDGRVVMNLTIRNPFASPPELGH
jgi:predicted nucleic acid-binding protein